MYKMVNKNKFEVSTLIYQGTMYEELKKEEVREFLKESNFQYGYFYESNTNVDYEDLSMDNSKYDITYIDKNDYMLSETNLNIIQLTIKLEELKKKTNINDGYLNIFNQKDRIKIEL